MTKTHDDAVRGACNTLRNLTEWQAQAMAGHMEALQVRDLGLKDSPNIASDSGTPVVC